MNLFLISGCVDCSRSMHHCCVQELLSLHGFVLIGLRERHCWSYMIVGLELSAFFGKYIRSIVAEPVGVKRSRC